MPKIIFFIKTEVLYFHSHISLNLKRIVTSNIIKTISSPLVSIFLNAFVWRATGSLIDVAVYNVAQFTALPVAFYLNGHILRRMHIKKAFALGTVLAGISSLALVLFGGNNTNLIPVYGLLWGLGNGFYWANRNYLELKETTTESRRYFYGLLSSVSSIANILVPLIAGWLIVLGEYFDWYLPQHAYWILFGIAFLLMIVSGQIIARGSFETPVIAVVSRFRKFTGSAKRRTLQIAIGLVDGTTYMSTLLVLTVLGNEGVLGSMSALTAICISLAMYAYGRYATQNQSNHILGASIILYSTCAASLLLFLLPLAYLSTCSWQA